MSTLAFEDGEVPLEWRLANPLGSYNDWIDTLVAPGTGFRRGASRNSAKAVAYVNHGRWVADCPLGDGGARRLKPGLEFFCIECGNTFEVEWPDAKTMEAIEAGLEPRSNRPNQNFHPDESTNPAKFLADENAANGIKAK